jgi:small-conductance mechanosensitive channel
LPVVSIAQSLSDKPISALIAGLGLGGLAFALAAQDTIKNLFGSLVIFSDKPFGLGDRINYDGHDGTIEEVGLRSTRLRRLDGHQVTIPNGELANKSIHNIAKRPFIRRIFTIGVTYDTSPEKVKEAKAILEDILKDHEGLDPKGELLPRVYFSDFSASSLDFKCMYWYHPPCILGLHGLQRTGKYGNSAKALMKRGLNLPFRRRLFTWRRKKVPQTHNLYDLVYRQTTGLCRYYCPDFRALEETSIACQPDCLVASGLRAGHGLDVW